MLFAWGGSDQPPTSKWTASRTLWCPEWRGENQTQKIELPPIESCPNLGELELQYPANVQDFSIEYSHPEKPHLFDVSYICPLESGRQYRVDDALTINYYGGTFKATHPLVFKTECKPAISTPLAWLRDVSGGPHVIYNLILYLILLAIYKTIVKRLLRAERHLYQRDDYDTYTIESLIKGYETDDFKGYETKDLKGYDTDDTDDTVTDSP